MYEIASQKCEVNAGDAIDVFQDVKVPGDGWPGYRILAQFFYPSTDGGSTSNFSKSLASRLRRALSIVLESAARNGSVLEDREADVLQEKVYLTMYPGGNMDVSEGSEVEEDGEGEGDGEIAHIVEVRGHKSGGKWNTLYRVDLGRGIVRDLTKYALKQEFPEEWKGMVARYKDATEKMMSSRKQLGKRTTGAMGGSDKEATEELIGNGGGIHTSSRSQLEENAEELGRDDHDAGVMNNDSMDGDPSPDTSGLAYYERRINDSTMVDSTDNVRKNLHVRDDRIHRASHDFNEGHGEGGMAMLTGSARPAGLTKTKRRTSEPAQRTLGVMAHRDVHIDRILNSGPSRKRQRVGTPLSGLGSLGRLGGLGSARHAGTPATGDRHFAARTDTAAVTMDFMSRILQNEEALKSEIEVLLAENKHLRGLIEDDELAMDIADIDDDLFHSSDRNAKLERQGRKQAEEILRAREQELRTVRAKLKKLQAENDHSLKDIMLEKEEWKEIATKAQEQLEKQMVQHATEVQTVERQAAAADKSMARMVSDMKSKTDEFSRQQEIWGKEKALMLNQCEQLWNKCALALGQLENEQARSARLDEELKKVQGEKDKQKEEYEKISKKMRAVITKVNHDLVEKQKQVALAMRQADENLAHTQAVADLWSKVPSGLANVEHILSFEDISGDKLKDMTKDEQETFRRLRPSQWVNCTITGGKHTKGKVTDDSGMSFVVRCVEPDAEGPPLVFTVLGGELIKRDYCLREVARYFLAKIKPLDTKRKAVEKHVSFATAEE